MGPATDERLTGWRSTQSDWPWYLSGILGWLALWKSIQEAPGKLALGFRNGLKVKMKAAGPGVLYEVYENMRRAMEAEANK